MEYLYLALLAFFVFGGILLIIKQKQSVKCVHVWGKVEKDNYQYCKRCGEAKVGPGCQHVWEVERRDDVQSQRSGKYVTVGEETVYKCKKCAERVYTRTSVSHDPITHVLTNTK